MSDVLYRKHRPGQFEDVAGQDHIVSILKKQVSEKNPSHAYLFVGGRGLGKTSLARIFAKSLDIAPEDIYEIDGASYRKLDDAKELKETISTLPISSEYKMYIIDEAHMLTKEAWNSLLKTIEEPPKHVIFIFATTEKQKVLPTIISRCVVFDFKTPNILEIQKLVTKVAKLENISLSETDTVKISYQAKGSFRDSLSILQAYQFTENHATENSLSHDAVKLLSSLENFEDAYLILESVDMGSLEYFFEIVINITTVILLTRYVKNYIDKNNSIDQLTLDVLLKKKEINSKFLQSLITVSEILNSSTHKKEHATVWLLGATSVEK